MTEWLLRYEGFAPEEERVREVLCTLGNGRFATRAAAPESCADGVHYPGTYAAGIFNRISADIDGRHVEHESMVNLPDWQSLRFRVEDGDWVTPSSATMTDYVQELDLRRGLLTRRFRVEDGEGRRTAVAQRRFVSMADPVVAGLDGTFVAENWSGRLVVQSGIDGDVANRGVARYTGLGDVHLRVTGAERLGCSVVALDVETRQSRLRVSMAARHRVLLDGQVSASPQRPRTVRKSGYIGQEFCLDVREGEQHTLEKVVAVYTSRDRAVSEPGAAARAEAGSLPELDHLLARHVLAWDHLWERCYVRIDAAESVTRALNLHLFHLLQTVSRHSMDLDVGIPARGLHGEAYRGHVFWDEIFVFPFLNLRMPELARALVLYRWRRLPQARAAAREAGFRGAMFPWQSGSDGREEAPAVHLNPRSRHWIADNSHLQRHINVAVAYNTWQYYEASGDRDFLAQFGTEVILNIAQFWASAASYDRVGDRYDIRNVMGPDEYHDGYPWRDLPGLDNNTYTNLMVVWTLRRALACIELLPDRRRSELLSLLGIQREDVERWEHMTRKMRLCWVADDVLAQFEGFERLRPFPWTEYVERYGDITRLDRILEAEGDSPNNYQLAKQADVLMLFYLLSADELADLLHRLGYQYTPRLIPSTVDFYRRCTSHGSTLSKVVHAWVMARSDRPAAWRFFLDALEADVAGHPGGTTGEGIHLGAMAGTVDLLQRAFTGLETRGEVLHLEPSLPDELASMSFRLHYRHHHGLEVSVDHDRVIISGQAHPAPPLTLRVRGEDHRLDPSGAVEVPLTSR